jgi:hypothetical protein
VQVSVHIQASSLREQLQVSTCVSDVPAGQRVQIATELQRPAAATRWWTVLETLSEATDRVFGPDYARTRRRPPVSSSRASNRSPSGTAGTRS